MVDTLIRTYQLTQWPVADVVETLSWLLLNSKQTVVFNQEDKVLIKVLRQEWGYETKKFV